MVAANTAQYGCTVSEPADPGGPPRLTRAGHSDDGDAVQARCVRSGWLSRRRPGPDRVLDRIRRFLLRPDLRPAPDCGGDGRIPTGAPGRAQRERLRSLQG